jgi:hypothetical protein
VEAYFHTQILSVYNELCAMGFGLKELKLLRYTISEIVYANNILPEGPVQKFLKDVGEEYDNKLGFESKLNSLRIEVNIVNQEQSKSRRELLLDPLIGSGLLRLI